VKISNINGKIISIAPARDGVCAYWADDDWPPATTQIEMWAITDTGDIFGIIALDEMSGEMGNAEASPNFIGYADDEDPLSDLEIRERTKKLREAQAAKVALPIPPVDTTAARNNITENNSQ
jgi:hypothetical protein